MSTRSAVRRRLRTAAERALLRVIGRDLRCSACGRVLFRGLPVVWRGRLKVIGAAGHNVRVAFGAEDALEFRHVELDLCPSPERPWVR